MKRPQTATMAFGEEQPGVYISHDTALFLASVLRHVIDHAEGSSDPPRPFYVTSAEWLHQLLLQPFRGVDAEEQIYHQQMKEFESCLKG